MIIKIFFYGFMLLTLMENNINIVHEDENGISLVKVILIYTLLMISTSSPLISHQLKDFIDDNRMVRHIFGFLTIMVLITLLKTNYKVGLSNMQIVLYSVIAYLWFLFSTKMDLHINLIFLSLLICAYLYDNFLRDKNKKVTMDKVLLPEEKDKIIRYNDNKEKVMFWGLIIATTIGAFLYSVKKQGQYGGGYSAMRFLFY